MRDPITGFEYPEGWRAKVIDEEWLSFVENGLAVLNSSGIVLRRGYSTGTTAAAACKAAVLSLREPIEAVSLTLPCGLRVDVPVTANDGVAFCKKYAGDHIEDPTAGAEFVAEAFPGGEGVTILPGEGIGEHVCADRVREALMPAISQNAFGMMMVAVRQAMADLELTGMRIELRVVDGDRMAIRTINARSGIGGGIAILGTTGLVDPWEDHVDEGRLDEVSSPKVVLTTGRMGLRFARLYYPEHELVLVGKKMKEALSLAQGEVAVCGLPGNIIKVVRPSILEEMGVENFDELISSPSWPEVFEDVSKAYSALNPRVELRLLDRNGRTIGVGP